MDHRVFIFICLGIFWFLLWFHCSPAGFFSSMLFSLHALVVFPFFFLWFLVDSLFHTLVVRKYTWYDLSFLKFTEASFVIQDVIYPGECSLWPWEESVICCFWMKCILNLSGLLCHLKLVFPYFFSFWMICPLVYVRC